MQESKENPSEGESVRSFSCFTLVLIALSIGAIGGAFWLSGAAIGEQARIIGFKGITSFFVVLCIVPFAWRSKVNGKQNSQNECEEINDDNSVASSLDDLDEAREFFAGSLKLADAFRLVSHRISDVMPFKALVLHVLNDMRTRMEVAHTNGVIAEDVDDGLANQSLSSGTVEIDSYLDLDSSQTFESSAAIPLRVDGTIFGVLQLFFDGENNAASVDKYLFEAVGERVAPLILSSLVYERNHANALTDITTELPNERAFYLMLEKQIAESHDNRISKPLTVLAIDIKNFDEINEKYGHAIGDQVLVFVAQITKDNLRQMDFLARSVNDEFLAILPTVSTEICYKIIERIQNAFATHRFEVDDDQSIEVELNIGWATYLNEGNTPSELLNFAELKKEQQKTPFAENILAFPRELAS